MAEMADRIVVNVDSDLEDLIPGFMDNRRKDLVKLEEMIGARDFDALCKIGHSIKGVGGGYGFDAITDFGAVIEKAAESQDIAALGRCQAEYADYLARVDVVFE
ncbi:MAG: Hpt domain-containing protein [Gammaproteobacteria bacterium]